MGCQRDFLLLAKKALLMPCASQSELLWVLHIQLIDTVEYIPRMTHEPYATSNWSGTWKVPKSGATSLLLLAIHSYNWLIMPLRKGYAVC